MTFREEMVSADPGPNVVPTTPERRADEADDGRQYPVVGGLEAHDHDPDELEPRVEPEQLVGERPSLGDNEDPG
jgi:hypothetical protein